jgi:hypothetical protein
MPTEKIHVDMLNPLKSTLRNSFPENEGWKLYNRYNWSSKVYDYVLQKEDNHNVFRIVVEINFGDQVTENEFEKLTVLSKRLSSGRIQVIRTVMVLQENTNVDFNLPKGIDVIRMSELIQHGIVGLQNKATGSKLVA